MSCQSILLQALPSNTAVVYVYRTRAEAPGDDRATLRECVALLAVPSSATTGPFPAASFSIPSAIGALDLREFWIDADGADNGVLVVGTHERKEAYI